MKKLCLLLMVVAGSSRAEFNAKGFCDDLSRVFNNQQTMEEMHAALVETSELFADKVGKVMAGYCQQENNRDCALCQHFSEILKAGAAEIEALSTGKEQKDKSASDKLEKIGNELQRRFEKNSEMVFLIAVSMIVTNIEQVKAIFEKSGTSFEAHMNSVDQSMQPKVVTE